MSLKLTILSGLLLQVVVGEAPPKYSEGTPVYTYGVVEPLSLDRSIKASCDFGKRIDCKDSATKIVSILANSGNKV